MATFRIVSLCAGENGDCDRRVSAKLVTGPSVRKLFQRFRRISVAGSAFSDGAAPLSQPGDRRFHRARIALWPAPGARLGDEVANNAVELVRILNVDGVAAIGHHR
jgi:hypothetical protein